MNKEQIVREIGEMSRDVAAGGGVPVSVLLRWEAAVRALPEWPATPPPVDRELLCTGLRIAGELLVKNAFPATGEWLIGLAAHFDAVAYLESQQSGEQPANDSKKSNSSDAGNNPGSPDGSSDRDAEIARLQARVRELEKSVVYSPPFFYCFRRGSEAPMFRHPTREDAEKEAIRLSGVTLGTIDVCAVVATVTPPQTEPEIRRFYDDIPF